MCYDISFSVQIKELADYFPDLIFDDQISIDFEKSIHIIGHAYGEHPIIYKNRDDEQLHCRLMEWGCIPFYVTDVKAFAKSRAYMLNARSEKILDDKKSYWNKIRNRRCLIPVTGFFEHHKTATLKKKIPFFIQLQRQPVFFLPGLYSVAAIADKETGEVNNLWTFTIITRAANSLMQQIHNDGNNGGRMPLLLPFESAKKWVEADLEEADYRAILNIEMPSKQLQPTTVFSIRTNKPRPDNKLKTDFYFYPEQLAVDIK